MKSDLHVLDCDIVRRNAEAGKPSGLEDDEGVKATHVRFIAHSLLHFTFETEVGTTGRDSSGAKWRKKFYIGSQQ